MVVVSEPPHPDDLDRIGRVAPPDGPSRGRPDPLSPWSVLAFLGLVGLWLTFAALPEPDPRWFRRVSRPCAYLAAGAMLVPYAHIIRRTFRYRYWGRMSTWLRWHVAASYLAFGLAIVHSRARSNNTLTLLIQASLWAVIVSGAAGLYGQKLLYRLMGFLVDEELGLERIGPERDRLAERGHALTASFPVLAGEDVPDWKALHGRLRQFAQGLDQALPVPNKGQPPLPPERQKLRGPIEQLSKALKPDSPTDADKDKILGALNTLLGVEGFRELCVPGGDGRPEGVRAAPPAAAGMTPAGVIKWRNHDGLCEQIPALITPATGRTEAVDRFFTEVLSRSLDLPLPSWAWLFRTRALVPVSANHYTRVKRMSGQAQREVLEQLWGLVEARRQLDLEYWIHRLGRSWLVIHGPASAALGALVLYHIALSVWYGGF
jgi:hypothetical protein